jgi:hypothetical protein
LSRACVGGSGDTRKQALEHKLLRSYLVPSILRRDNSAAIFTKA